jgi:hypothetical protein
LFKQLSSGISLVSRATRIEGHPGGRRKTGRPRKRWLDDIEEDLRLMKVKRLRNKTTDRKVWAKTVWEAKPLHGQ